jgi:hypothetical protein
MTQKPLLYIVTAIAVGYLLVSTLPHQIALYSAYPLKTMSGDGELTAESIPESGSDSDTRQEDQPSNNQIFGETDEYQEISFIEISRLSVLVKWWMLDVLLAFTIYWVAKQRLS